MLPRAVQILFGLIGLVLIMYVALLGLNAFFDWIDPGSSAGRTGRIGVGIVVGLGVTLAIIAFRRFRK
jgi:hypothetical protein